MIENQIIDNTSSFDIETLRQLEFLQVLDFVKRYSYSELGKELIQSARPVNNYDWLREEHSLINEMIGLLAKERELPIEGLSDVRNQFHKSQILNSALSTEEILAVRDLIRASRIIKKFFSDRSEVYKSLYELTNELHENRIIEKHISDAIEDTGEVKDNASKELSRIRREIFEKSNHLRKRIDKILRKVADEDMTQEEFVSLREGRFVIPIKSEHKRHIPGIIHGVSQTGATVFIEPSEIIELNNDISLLSNEERREIYRILANLTSEIGEDAVQFLRSISILGRLDSIGAKAKYASDFGGIMPEIRDDHYLLLKDIRHPLLVHSKGLKKVSPLTIEFNKEKRGHLISGPNAGGKTVALKSIGLNVLMALSGLFPLGYCILNFRNVYSSIGDQQSIENDLSTFSSQVLRIKDILSLADPNSLILIDEIGSGTDPYEGSALAAGILDTLLNLHSFFMATTHQSSLKTYALNRHEIENSSLEFDTVNLKPTYKFLQGIPGNSYAFHLAKSIGLSQLVLDRAKHYLGDRHDELESSIAVLQEYRSDIEKLKRDIENEKNKLEKSRTKFESRFNELKEKRSQYLDKARTEASEIISKANSLIENTIREIKEEKRAFSEIKEDFNKEKNKLSARIASGIKKTDEISDKIKFNPGDSVAIEETGSVGVIIDIQADKNLALVEFNGLKFNLPLSQLVASKPKVEKTRTIAEFFSFDAQSSIDVRGMRAEESLREIDNYIGKAIKANLDNLTIIHGKGTGALRAAIHQFLKHHHYIRSFRLGELVEGGAGVTIIELEH